MSTIRERAHQFADKHMKPCGTHTIYCMVKFAESERTLQRQECAIGLEKWWKEGKPYGVGDWLDNAKHAILTACVEPTNPFGCGCWRLTNNMWTRNDTATIGCFVVMPSDAAFCDRCGAKRRKS